MIKDDEVPTSRRRDLNNVDVGRRHRRGRATGAIERQVRQ